MSKEGVCGRVGCACLARRTGCLIACLFRGKVFLLEYILHVPHPHSAGRDLLVLSPKRTKHSLYPEPQTRNPTSPFPLPLQAHRRVVPPPPHRPPCPAAARL